MKLKEALEKAGIDTFFVRQKWLDDGSNMKLFSSIREINNLHIQLSPESFFADDWLIVGSGCKFTEAQRDWICYQIGEWYLLMKPLLEGQHNLGYMKEKLKSMICDNDEDVL